MDLPVLRTPASSADVSFGYTYSAYGPASHLPVADPTRGITLRPESGPDANFFVAWGFSNAHAWPYSISNQEGRRLQLALQLSDPAVGSRFHTTELTAYWAEYFTPPWARLHALALFYSGGIGIGDKRAFFGLGGYVEQDLLRATFLNEHQCCTFLRGYEPNATIGDQYHLLSVEYRAPLVWIERGSATFPFYMRRVHGAVFADAGEAFFGALKVKDVKKSVGAELRFQMTLIYYIETEVQLGYAHGFSKIGGDHLYVVSSFPF